MSAPPLLGTKLRIPRRRRSVVPRPRLHSRLVGRDLPAAVQRVAPKAAKAARVAGNLVNGRASAGDDAA